MEKIELTTKGPKETEEAAKIMAEELLNSKLKFNGAMLIALEGELGAGKTVFTKGFAKGLGIKDKITSPTFVLIRKYPIGVASSQQSVASKNSKIDPSPQLLTISCLVHIDAYRLNDSKDLKPLKVDELIKDSGNIILVEWAERVKKILPKEHITVHIDHISPKERKITIQ